MGIVFTKNMVNNLNTVTSNFAKPGKMDKNNGSKMGRPKRRESGTAASAGTRRVRRDSLIRTKEILNAALRVWELKRRIRPEHSL